MEVREEIPVHTRVMPLVTYNGIGQTTNAGASLRIAPLFETGDSRYVWLTRLAGGRRRRARENHG